MKDFERLAQYAKDKVASTETPLSLYNRAIVRKNLIDSAITVLVSSIILALATIQLPSQTTIQSPAMKQAIQQDLVATVARP